MENHKPLSATATKVLVTLAEEPQRHWYGAELAEALEASPGTVHPILRRFEAIGWVTARLEGIDPILAGRPARKYFEMTNSGLIAAVHIVNDQWTPSILALLNNQPFIGSGNSGIVWELVDMEDQGTFTGEPYVDELTFAIASSPDKAHGLMRKYIERKCPEYQIVQSSLEAVDLEPEEEKVFFISRDGLAFIAKGRAIMAEECELDVDQTEGEIEVTDA